VASNFDFIANEWPPLFDECLRAERYVRSAPRASLIYSRSARLRPERRRILLGLREPDRSALDR
jgi:hypothetical protein